MEGFSYSAHHISRADEKISSVTIKRTLMRRAEKLAAGVCCSFSVVDLSMQGIENSNASSATTSKIVLSAYTEFLTSIALV